MPTMRSTLSAAVTQRKMAMKHSRSHKDQDAVRAAIGKAEVFLWGYPVASDETVRRWCVNNLTTLDRILDPRNKAQRTKLTGQ